MLFIHSYDTFFCYSYENYYGQTGSLKEKLLFNEITGEKRFAIACN